MKWFAIAAMLLGVGFLVFLLYRYYLKEEPSRVYVSDGSYEKHNGVVGQLTLKKDSAQRGIELSAISNEAFDLLVAVGKDLANHELNTYVHAHLAEMHLNKALPMDSVDSLFYLLEYIPDSTASNNNPVATELDFAFLEVELPAENLPPKPLPNPDEETKKDAAPAITHAWYRMTLSSISSHCSLAKTTAKESKMNFSPEVILKVIKRDGTSREIPIKFASPIQVQVGDTIQWENRETAPSSAVFSIASNEFVSDVVLVMTESNTVRVKLDQVKEVLKSMEAELLALLKATATGS